MPRWSNLSEDPRRSTEYRLTRSDRRGPNAALLYRAVPYMLLIFGCCVFLFARLGVPLLFALPLSAGVTGAVTWAGFRFATTIGEGFAHFVLPTGETTPYEHQFSREDALAARGDIAGALESLEAAIGSTPITAQTGINVRIRAAELHMGPGGDPKRAVALFREIQRYPAVASAQDIYVSNRLIDLLLGPLKQPSRALVELRRIADRYPSSNAAAHARTAIGRIKREIESGE